ncbi:MULTISPECIES: hypothetical protein [Gordonia]|uniref:Uncharacterized protein n=1 Tax=Gordonia sihwensis NBRC 108236 TaxID=1223544 RepID=L7LLN4_9ACTN|nr:MULTISPECIES: hypothetical protein [Gordonia]GAC61799.1 hypothetical protein GSI01S_21_00470 [Gordonia sihwensis NBRC 108236]
MDIEEFATTLVRRHGTALDDASRDMATGALDAGEFEVAAIIVAEDAADVSAEEMEQLLALSADFDEQDVVVVRNIARRLAS